jgi:glycosyltransferase involved in cell wall biosynthesis
VFEEYGPIPHSVAGVVNRRQFIGEAIESVFGQSLSDVELIVQDDASTNSGIAEQVLAYQDPRIRYERNRTNQHIAGNLNIALSRCRAPYVHVLADDDRMRASNLERKVEFLERNHAHIHSLGTAVRRDA